MNPEEIARLITEDPDVICETHEQAITILLQELQHKGYHLVRHTWEEGTNSVYIGYFLARNPAALDTYKIGRSLKDADAYLLCHWFDDELNMNADNIVWPGDEGNEDANVDVGLIVPVDEMLDDTDETDQFTIAKFLWDLTEGNDVSRWSGYRSDSKSDKPLINFNLLTQPDQQAEKGDLWKEGDTPPN